jgi:O-glycosyl hydrolase
MARRFHGALAASTLIFTIGMPLLGQTRISVDPAVMYQRFEGWGTSLCWWANTEGAGSLEYRNKIADVLIDPDSGLGFTIFRYNIGGGDQPGHNHMRTGGAIPGYRPADTGAYDWTADQYQRNMVAALVQTGAQKNQTIIWEAFSNSPPWWMTISGCAAGNVSGADNLKTDCFDDFADYLTEVVKHFRDSWGLTFRTIEPFNEPSAGWWTSGNNQEGCGFKAGQSRMVKELGRSLVARGLFPETCISAADENAVNQAISGLAAYDDSAFSYMTQINTHTYYGRTSANFTTLMNLSATKQKTVWQSETGPLAGTGNQDIAMFMSQYIIQDLRMLKPNAWLDWQTVGSGDWGTFQINRTNLALIPTRRYYMLAAFSRFIRPGSLFIESSDSNSLAALVPGTRNGVFIIRNGGNSSINYTWDLARFATMGSSAAVFQFLVSNYQALSKLPDVAITNKQFTVTSPAQSITTCIVPGIAETALQPADRTLPQPRTLAMTSGNRNAINLFLPFNGEYSLTIFNSCGKKVCHQGANGAKAGIHVDVNAMDLSGGVYVVQLRQRGSAVSGIFYLVR